MVSTQRLLKRRDQHDILGLGANMPIATGNRSDSLHALPDGRIAGPRVPYRMGFFAKQIDGRRACPEQPTPRARARL